MKKINILGTEFEISPCNHLLLQDSCIKASDYFNKILGFSNSNKRNDFICEELGLGDNREVGEVEGVLPEFNDREYLNKFIDWFIINYGYKVNGGKPEKGWYIPIGTIGVRTWDLKGSLVKSTDLNTAGLEGNLSYSAYSSIPCNNWRFATPEEIVAYNKGIRHASDIKTTENKEVIPTRGSYKGSDALEVYLEYFKPLGEKFLNQYQEDLEHNISKLNGFTWGGVYHMSSGPRHVCKQYTLQEIKQFFNINTNNYGNEYNNNTPTIGEELDQEVGSKTPRGIAVKKRSVISRIASESRPINSTNRINRRANKGKSSRRSCTVSRIS